MRAMTRITAHPLCFVGVGGEGMLRAGLQPVFAQSDLAVMGLAEIVPRLPRLMNRLRQLADVALKTRPDAVVTIDSSSFNRPLARRLRRAGITVPMIHFVAPMVWAWRPRRAAQLAGEFDHLLTLFSFEPPLFKRHGLATTWVGHPLTEVPPGNGDGFRRANAIPADAPLLCVLPGSRRGEVERLLKPFGDTVSRVAAALSDLQVVVPTLPHLADLIRSTVRTWPKAIVLVGDEARQAGIAAANVALTASGTVTLELAAAGVPMVVAYRMNPLTVWLARRLLRVRHVSLPNILLDADAVPERLQGDCHPATLSQDLLRLLGDVGASAEQKAALAAAVSRLCPEGSAAPSERAAQVVLTLIGQSLAGESARPQIDRGFT